MSSALAYRALIAFFTGMVLVIGLIGYVVQDPVIQDELLQEVVRLVPPLEPIVSQALDGLAASAAALSILGAIGLAWGASGFYDALDRSFARIFRTAPVRTMISRLVRGFISVGLLVVVVAAGSVLAFIQGRLTDALPGGPEGDWGRALSSVVFLLLAMSLEVVAVAFLFRVVPNTRVPLAALGPPAVLVGIALMLLTQLFVLIAPLLVGAVSVFGVFAAVFAALAWLSFVFQGLLLGAVWTRLRMDLSLDGNSQTAVDVGESASVPPSVSTGRQSLEPEAEAGERSPAGNVNPASPQ
jgi:YihY family inner membrane protein